MSESTLNSVVNNVIALTVPGKIECRSLVLRTVSAACKLGMAGDRSRRAVLADFTNEIVSAVGEAYNNIVLHGYASGTRGSVEVVIENCQEWMRITIRDTGVGFDPDQLNPPDLASLPESGLGVFIMRSFVDEMTYTLGPPNVLTLFKRLDESSLAASMCPSSPSRSNG